MSETRSTSLLTILAMSPQRHRLRERHRVPFRVPRRHAALARVARRVDVGFPDEPGVLDADGRVGEHGTDEDRHADRPGGRSRSRRRRRRCAAGRCRGSSPATRPGRGGGHRPAVTGAAELDGGPDVVVEHGAALRVEVQAEPRHVALHDRHVHRRSPARPLHRHEQRPATTTTASGGQPRRRSHPRIHPGVTPVPARRPAVRRHGRTARRGGHR